MRKKHEIILSFSTYRVEKNPQNVEKNFLFLSCAVRNRIVRYTHKTAYICAQYAKKGGKNSAIINIL